MEHNRPVTEECSEPFLSGGIEIRIGRLEGALGRGRDGPKLAREITDLAGLGEGRVAWGGLAALEGVEMGEGRGAVTVCGGGNVKVVSYCERD